MNKKPISCCVVPSVECFFKCKMCYLWKTPPEPNRILPEEWKSFIDSLGGILDDRKELIFSGGEPLMNEEIVGLIDYGGKKGLRTVLSTNAFLIDEAKAIQLAEAGLKEIYISLDSFREETHDFLRGQEGSHRRVMHAIEYLDRHSAGLKINIITVISQRNLAEIVELIKRVNSGNIIDGVYIQVITQPFATPFDEYWQKSSEYSFLWPQDLKSVYSAIDELINLKGQGYRIINNIKHLEKFKSYFEDPNTFVTKAKCYLGNYAMNVNPAGDVFLCCFTEPVGNIKKDRIGELWFSDAAQQKRNEMYRCKRNCHSMVNCFFMEEEER